MASFLSKTCASQRFMGSARFATEAKPAGRGTGIRKVLTVSEEFQSIIGVSETTRGQAMKQIWAYIKAKNLQDTKDKKIIVCDDKLKKLFGGKDRVGMLEMGRLLSPHLKN